MPIRPRLRSLVAGLAAVPLLVAVAAVPAAARRPRPVRRPRRLLRVRQRHGVARPQPLVLPQQPGLRPPRREGAPQHLLSFRACSGAKTGDVTGGQTAALSASTDFVTVSIGGNDVGFVDLILSCFSSWDELLCRSTVSSVDRKIDTQLPAKLDATYADIRTGPRREGHRRRLPAAVRQLGPCSQASGVNSREAALLDGVAAHLDRVLAARAAAAGSPSSTSCRPSPGTTCAATPYLWGKKTGLLDIYHPTRAGHRDGFAPLVRAALG